MTYDISRGGKLTAKRFNGLRDRVLAVLNDTHTVSLLGYGHPMISSPVQAGGVVRPLEWNKLRSDVSKVHKHQFGSELTEAELPLVVTGNVIRKADFDKLDACLTKIEANTLRYANTSMGVFALGKGVRASSWGVGASSIRSIETVTFASADIARYFFNSGGAIRIKMAHPGAHTTPQDFDWLEMTSRVGTISIAATSIQQTGNTGMSIGAGLGGWDSMSTAELTVLNAINSGNVYRHTRYPVYNTFTASYQVNDIRISVRKTEPDANGRVSLVITSTLTDDHTSQWFDRVSAGTTITVDALKAVNPINNVLLVPNATAISSSNHIVFSTTNFTSNPVTPAMFSRMLFMQPSAVAVEVSNDRMFNINYTSNNAVTTNTGQITVRVPGETVEFVQLSSTEQEPTPTIAVVNIINTYPAVTLEYQSKVSNPSVTKVKLKIKTFQRSSWIVVDYLALEDTETYSLVGRVVDDVAVVGYPVDVTVSGDNVTVSPPDNSPIGMVSLWAPSNKSLAGLTPPSITSSVASGNGRQLVLDTTKSSAIGDLRFTSRRASMVLEDVAFTDSDKTPHFATQVQHRTVKISTVNNNIMGAIHGFLLIDVLDYGDDVSVELLLPSKSRVDDGALQVSSIAVEPEEGKWRVSFMIPADSNASFVNLMITDGDDRFVFRDVCVRPDIAVSAENRIYTSSNPHSLDSTTQNPVFEITTNVTASGSGQLVVAEHTRSFVIDSVEVTPSGRLPTSSPAITQAMGKPGNDVSLKFKSNGVATYGDIKIVSGARVYLLCDVHFGKSSTALYSSELMDAPHTVEVKAITSVSEYPDRVKVIVKLEAVGREISAFKRDTTEWSAGWEPADAPLFDVHGSAASDGSYIKEVLIPITHWPRSSASKTVNFLVKMADGLYCNAEIDIMRDRYSVICDLREPF